jgi:hypothetical protein
LLHEQKERKKNKETDLIIPLHLSFLLSNAILRSHWSIRVHFFFPLPALLTDKDEQAIVIKEKKEGCRMDGGDEGSTALRNLCKCLRMCERACTTVCVSDDPSVLDGRFQTCVFVSVPMHECRLDDDGGR